MPIAEKSQLVAFIPLSKAMLCLNERCEAIFEVGPNCCPACTDGAMVPVKSMLEGRFPRWVDAHAEEFEKIR